MILCCGEALIDMIPVDHPGGRAAFVPHSGGAIFNTAIGLGRLGVAVSMLSGVSRDDFGAQLAQELRDNGVATDLLVRSDRLTTWITDGGVEAILAHGPSCVIVTEGAKGATAHRASGAVAVPAQKAEVVDTVGAGDTFNSGFLASLARAGLAGKSAFAAISDAALEDALHMAARVAAVTVSRAGANPPTAQELGL